MSILLAVTLAAASAAQPSCSWDHPGVNPYKGRIGDAIDRYTDIPAAVRSTLRRRIEEQQSDDMVTITRDGITGKNQYDPAIRDMHFGAASVCATVTRGKWAETRQEPGAVYCVGEHCILVPKICGNVSRISRLPVAAVAKNTSDRPAAAPGSQARRNLGDGFNSKDLGLADAARPETPPQQADTNQADGQPDTRTDAAQDAADKLARQAGSGQGVEEFTLDGKEYDIDSRGHLSGLYGRHSSFGEDEDTKFFNPTPVPEADTWAMLLAGLGLVGFAARRARRKPTAGQPG
jgi:hypothetical protein